MLSLAAERRQLRLASRPPAEAAHQPKPAAALRGITLRGITMTFGELAALKDAQDAKGAKLSVRREELMIPQQNNKR